MSNAIAWLLILVAASAVSAVPARADDLARVQQAGVLRWGGDQEGGGPYIYPREDNAEEIQGFEVDLAGALARSLPAGDRPGAAPLRAEFVQSQWDKLPDMLRTAKVDLVLNGFERTPERLAAMEVSVPYYVYALQLLARRGDPQARSWEALRQPRGERKAKIGVLTGSAAQTWMSEFCKDACEVVGYDGNTDAMREVETGKLDATLQDTPIATFYLPRFAQLEKIGAPVGRGYYVVLMRKGETALRKAVDGALLALLRSGELERLYRRYHLWDAQQQELMDLARHAELLGIAGDVTAVQIGSDAGNTAVAERLRGWAVWREYGGILLRAAGMTVLIAVLAFPLAVILGLLLAVARLYGPRWMAPLVVAWVELLRGTPLMLQLYCIFFLLPEFGIQVPAFWTGVLGLAINYSAYESEIYRAGLQAVPGGQLEAGLALGLSRSQALRLVVVPQAARMVVPPVVSDFIACFKDTSVCSVVTLVELTKRFTVLSMSTQATVELMALTALLYLLMSYPLSLVARRLEARLHGEGRPDAAAPPQGAPA